MLQLWWLTQGPPLGQGSQEAGCCHLNSSRVLNPLLENRASEALSSVNVYMLEGEMLLNT